MAKVYSQADEVVIWLGKEDNNTLEVLKHASELKRANDIIETHNLTLDRQLCPYFMSSTDIPGYDNPVWKALNDFLRRPWFKRVWVIQEEALAQKRIYLCGQYVFGNGLITGMIPWLQAYQSDFFTSTKAQIESSVSSEKVIRIDWDKIEESFKRKDMAMETYIVPTLIPNRNVNRNQHRFPPYSPYTPAALQMAQGQVN